MIKIYILTLTYYISFNDADDGECYAGEGRRIVSVHKDRTTADATASEFSQVFARAENESCIYPIQPYNNMLKEKFGFTVHDIDNGYNFKLVVETLDVEA